MKKVILIIIIAINAVSTSLSLEPMKVAFIYTAGGPINVHVQLADNINNAIFVGETFTGVSANGSGVVIVNVEDYAGSANAWTNFQASDITTSNTIDIYVGTTLYAQYRLDALIQNQAQVTVFDNDGNFNPPSPNSTLGTDDNRWRDAFVSESSLHVGPDDGMTNNQELAIHYNNNTNVAEFKLDGTNELVINSTGLKISGGITANPSGADKDFIFGDDNFEHSSGIEAKMYFDKSKGAFRAGAVTGNEWNDANIGDYSTAMGNNTTARGSSSAAMGNNTTASGPSSTAMGFNATANGITSTAMGFGTTASGDYSTAMGHGTTASGNTSTAMGGSTIAIGDYSTAMGIVTTANGSSSTAMGSITTASGFASTAMGYYTIASGSSSTAMGSNTTASGTASTAMGYHTIADEENSVALGEHNDNTVTGELLTIGNGTSNSVRSNALEVYKNGDVVVPALAGGGTQYIQADNNGKLLKKGSTVSVYVSSSPPTNAEFGSLYYNTTTSNLYILIGNLWTII